jgi:hypothetical protein
LYRTIIIGADPIDDLPACDIETFTRIARTKPNAFLNSVRNVMAIRIDPEELNAIIRACRRIDNLFMLPAGDLHSSTHSAPPGFDNLPLRHLYCDLYRVFDQTAMKNVDFMSPVFLNLTHLELMDGLDQSDDTPDEALARWARLSDLPKLTHLALNSSRDLPLCIHLLAVCRSLRALILLRRPPYNVSAEIDLLANNPRFVMMPVENYIADWQRGVLGCKYYWARADALIAQRMSGEIDRASVPEY